MPSDDDQTTHLIREFDEFKHNLYAAIRLSYFAFQEETERVLRVAFFPFAYKGQTSERPANTNEILWVKDADDPRRWKPIPGRRLAERSSPKSKAQATARAKARVENQRLMSDLGLWYYLDVLLERMITHVRRHFKKVAALAKRYSSSDLLLREAHLAAGGITASQNKNQDKLGFLCEFWGRPEFAAQFKDKFQAMFVREFERLRSEAELEEPIAVRKTELTESPRGTTRMGSVARSLKSDGQLLQMRASVGVSESSSVIEQIVSSHRKPLSTLLMLARIENPGMTDTRELLIASDKMIADIRSEAERKRCYKAVHASVPAGWKTRIGEQKTLAAYWDAADRKKHGPIKSYVSAAKVSRPQTPKKLVS